MPQILNISKEDGSDSDEIGPSIPISSSKRPGPAIPNFQDLEYRRELLADDQAAAREEVSYERRQERKLEQERLNELVPKADAGTRERQLEKKSEITAVHASFKDRKSPGAEEVADDDLLGNDGIDAYKRKKKDEEMKKSARQLRREEVERARTEERRERVQAMQIKEDKTMEMLQALAKQRYG